MDRHINFIAQQFKHKDILYSNLYSHIALGKLAGGVMSIDTHLVGLTCTQTATPSMAVLIGPGEIYQEGDIDTTDYGSLPLDARQILKQGILAEPVVTDLLDAPLTVGQSVNYLVEFAFLEEDGNPEIEPYYDETNPPVPLQGEGGDGVAQNTARLNKVTYQIVAGIAATTGTQVTPTPDAGYIGAYVITVTQGQTTIINSDITVYPGAPFFVSSYNSAITKDALQTSSFIYALDTSVTANIVTATINPAITAYTTGHRFFIKIANNNTGASTLELNGLGQKTITKLNGNALEALNLITGQIAEFVYDGTNFQLQNVAPFYTTIQNNTFNYALDTSGAADTVTADLTPALTAHITGMTVFIKIANTNTGASTINLNALGAKNIKFLNGNALIAGNLQSGQVAEFIYDGTNYILQAVGRPTLKGVKRVNTRQLLTSGTFTPTSGTAFIRVRMVGGGGGTGAISIANYGASSGSNSGNYLEFWMSAAQIGASKSYSCGVAGTAGSAGAAGGTGGNTTFGDWVAAGGVGGAAITVSGATNRISTLPAPNSANTIGTGTLVSSFLGCPPSYGVATTIPLGFVSIGGISNLYPFNLANSGHGAVRAALSGTISPISGSTSGGFGGSGCLLLNANLGSPGATGGAGSILVDEYIIT